MPLHWACECGSFASDRLNVHAYVTSCNMPLIFEFLNNEFDSLSWNIERDADGTPGRRKPYVVDAADVAVPLHHAGRGGMAFRSKRVTSQRDKELKKAEQERLEAALEEGLKDTFPASDAVAVIQPAPERSISDVEQATEPA
jgi:hypothetical protein